MKTVHKHNSIEPVDEGPCCRIERKTVAYRGAFTYNDEAKEGAWFYKMATMHNALNFGKANILRNGQFMC